jgi:hypothetical protein
MVIIIHPCVKRVNGRALVVSNGYVVGDKRYAFNSECVCDGLWGYTGYAGKKSKVVSKIATEADAFDSLVLVVVLRSGTSGLQVMQYVGLYISSGVLDGIHAVQYLEVWVSSAICAGGAEKSTILDPELSFPADSRAMFGRHSVDGVLFVAKHSCYVEVMRNDGHCRQRNVVQVTQRSFDLKRCAEGR